VTGGVSWREDCPGCGRTWVVEGDPTPRDVICVCGTVFVMPTASSVGSVTDGDFRPRDQSGSRGGILVRVARSNADLAREAWAALRRGDVEQAVSFMHEDIDWRGVRRGHLWWAHRPG
jgi:hypothetical protein